MDQNTESLADFALHPLVSRRLWTTILWWLLLLLRREQRLQLIQQLIGRLQELLVYYQEKHLMEPEGELHYRAPVQSFGDTAALCLLCVELGHCVHKTGIGPFTASLPASVYSHVCLAVPSPRLYYFFLNPTFANRIRRRNESG